MIIKESIVKVIDNSGAKTAKCIGFWKGRSKVAGLGDTIVVSIQRTTSAKRNVRKKATAKDKKESKVNKGEVCLAVVVQVRQLSRRPTGERIGFNDSAVVLVNETGAPRGTRILTSVATECNNLKILSLATKIA